jgi:hypothetical protein
MVKLKYYISGAGQRDCTRLTVGQGFTVAAGTDVTDCEFTVAVSSENRITDFFNSTTGLTLSSNHIP